MSLFRKAKPPEPVIDLVAEETLAEQFARQQAELEAATAALRADAHEDTVRPMETGR